MATNQKIPHRNVTVGIGDTVVTKLGPRRQGWRTAYHLIHTLAWLEFFAGVLAIYLTVHPVFAGDTLYAEREVLAKRESASRPGAGLVTVSTTGKSQDGTSSARSPAPC